MNDFLRPFSQSNRGVSVALGPGGPAQTDVGFMLCTANSEALKGGIGAFEGAEWQLNRGN